MNLLHTASNVGRGLLVGMLAAGIHGGRADAQLVGGHVVAGRATITETPTGTLIIEKSRKAIIDWSSFSIPPGYSVVVEQVRGTGSVVLDQVTGGTPSVLSGVLTANGQFVLVNGAGITVGPQADITAASVILSTAGIANRDFLSGDYNFAIPGQAGAAVVNRGTIVAVNGSAILAGDTVANDGVVTAALGTVVLAGAKTYAVDFSGDHLLSFAVTTPVDGVPGPLVSNTGTLAADGGLVLLTAAAAKGVLDNVINTSGIIEATSVASVDGKIVLTASGGGTEVNGTLDASGKGAGETGGTVEVTGDSVTLAAGARIDVSGEQGGGTALIGGNFHGAGPLPDAATTTVAAGAVIDADAIAAGPGGSVAVWSDGATTVAGTITARGGAAGGAGGSVETSGTSLDIAGITVDAGAPAGAAGTWLLDPTDLTIDAAAASAIATGLATGAVIIETGSGSSICSGSADCGTAGPGSNGDITVAASIGWNSTNVLVLSAFRDIVINPGVTISDAAAGALDMRADNTGTGTGSIIFGAGAAVNFTEGGVVLFIYNPLDNPAGSSVNATSYSSTVGYSGGTPGYAGEVVLGNGAQLLTYMLVNTISDFQDIANNTVGTYLLSNNIDASATVDWNSGAGFVPIINFTGTFAGQDNTIDGIFINAAPGQVGPFGTILAGGTVSDLNLTNVNITMQPGCDGCAVGGLVGTNEGTIVGVTVSGTVTGGSTDTIGGLAGVNVGTILLSSADVTVSGVFSNYAGGLVGANTDGGISDSFATGSVTSDTSAVGGLVGYNDGAYVTNAYATGAVNGGSDDVGGLIGLNLSGTISYTYAAGPMTGGDNIGGLIGYNADTVVSSYWATDTTGLGNGIGYNGGSGSPTGMTAAQLASGLPAGFDPSVWTSNSGINGGLPSLIFQTPAPLVPSAGPPSAGPAANPSSPAASSSSSGSSASPAQQGELAASQSSAPPSSSFSDTADANPSPQFAPSPATASAPLAPAGGDQGQGAGTSLSFGDIDQGGTLFTDIVATGGGEGSSSDAAFETITPWKPAPSPFPAQSAADPIGGPGSHLLVEHPVVVPPGGFSGIDFTNSSLGNRALWYAGLRP